MRDFDVVFNNEKDSDKKKAGMQEIIIEAFHGIGEIQLGVNITDLSTISEQYREFLINTCAMDCYIFTPSAMVSIEEKNNFAKIFKNLKAKNAYVKFINIYDSSIDTELEATYEIFDYFIKNKVGEYLYSMDINKELYINATYLNKVKNECLARKEGTEVKINNLNGFLTKYDQMIQSKDEYTAEHGRAVCKFAIEIGKKIGLDTNQLEILAIGAALHDIGKYEIDIKILTKNKRLSDPEFIQIKNHPMIGKLILDAVSISELSERDNEIIEFIVEQHHERYDGTGYPRKIDGTIIHEYSMIVSLSDAFHAMLGRSYQSPKKKSDIIKNIMDCSGTQFNPKYVTIFCDMLENDVEALGLCENNGYLKYSATQSIAELVMEAK